MREIEIIIASEIKKNLKEIILSINTLLMGIRALVLKTLKIVITTKIQGFSNEFFEFLFLFY